MKRLLIKFLLKFKRSKFYLDLEHTGEIHYVRVKHLLGVTYVIESGILENYKGRWSTTYTAIQSIKRDT